MPETANSTRPSAVLFDLDGTLADTADDFVLVLNLLRQQHGFESLDSEHIRATVSDGARALTHLAFGGHEGEPDFESKRQQLLALYFSKVGDSARLFSGMEAVLEQLESQSIPWGVVTNKPKKYTERLFTKLGLAQRCAVLVCPDDVVHAKPDPEGLLLAATKLSIRPDNCWYVGDHIRDIEAGRAAGMTTIAARYGYIKPEDAIEHWQAHSIINIPTDLLPLFQ